MVFEVRRGGVVVANGSVTRGAPHLASPRTQPPPPRAGTEFPAVEQLVPHRGPMLLAREVLTADPDSLSARAVVPSSNALALSGLCPAWLGLEAAAQAAALHEALGRMAAASGAPSAPRIGYLVAVRDALLAEPFPAGTALIASVRAAGAAGGLASYEAAVSLEADGRPVARGRLSTYSAA